MHEVLILGAGIMVGTIGTGCAVYLGGHLVLRTYMELTQPHLLLPNTVEDDTDKTSDPEGYDWEEYDAYLKPPMDDSGGEPEA